MAAKKTDPVTALFADNGQVELVRTRWTRAPKSLRRPLPPTDIAQRRPSSQRAASSRQTPSLPDMRSRTLAAYKAGQRQSPRTGSTGIVPIDFLQLVSDPVCDAATLFVDCETASYAWGQSMSARIGRPAKSAAPVHNYVPIIFSAWDKTDQSDDLLVCFGALAIGQVTRTEIPAVWKVIYGEAHGSRTVRIGDRLPNTRRVVEAIISFCRSEEPPPVVLNKHCPTCDFHSRCRAIAVERDNLSLLGGMTAKERAKYEEKGISTITQLSYGYRPRRRKRVKPPLLRGSPLIKHDHRLKALAIKKAQTHVVGSPSLCIAGTPVFMDVEGMRDRDFYYLIGLRYESEGKPVEQSYWANGPENESDIWQQCLRLLRGIENPRIVHYGALGYPFNRTGRFVSKGDSTKVAPSWADVRVVSAAWEEQPLGSGS